MAYQLHASVNCSDWGYAWEYVETFDDWEEAMTVGSDLSTFRYFQVWDTIRMVWCGDGISCAGRRALENGRRSLEELLSKNISAHWSKEGF